MYCPFNILIYCKWRDMKVLNDSVLGDISCRVTKIIYVWNVTDALWLILLC